jgi:hypothetical protein
MSFERDLPAHHLDEVPGADAIDDEIGKDTNNDYAAEEAGNRPSKQV